MAKLTLLNRINRSSLLKNVTCLNCWHTFPPEEILWVSVDPTLAGEPQLPSSLSKVEQKRFQAERFDVEGRAIDAAGSPCTQVACPKCRLTLPRPAIEISPLIFSLLGAAGSGKSVFLASMMFTLRQTAATLGLRFLDADLSLNKTLYEDERRLFLSGNADSYRSFDVAVTKTSEEDDPRWRLSIVDGHEAKFVPPYTFLVTPTANHPRGNEEESLAGLLCLYDNAGEHFRPGSDTTATPLTRHLAKSRGLMFTFDPTKDRRVARMLGNRSVTGIGDERQDVVLIEATNRIREHSGLASRARIPQPLIVVLTKFDAWHQLVPGVSENDAFRTYPKHEIRAISMDAVNEISIRCREFLTKACPEIVSTADSVSDEVYFIPVAAVGWDVTTGKNGSPEFKASSLAPFWVEVPLLTLMCRAVPRLVPSLRRTEKQRPVES